MNGQKKTLILVEVCSHAKSLWNGSQKIIWHHRKQTTPQQIKCHETLIQWFRRGWGDKFHNKFKYPLTHSGFFTTRFQDGFNQHTTKTNTGQCLQWVAGFELKSLFVKIAVLVWKIMKNMKHEKCATAKTNPFQSGLLDYRWPHQILPTNHSTWLLQDGIKIE